MRAGGFESAKMTCGECCGRFGRCCCSCLSRIPYGTTIGLFVAICGMALFIGGFLTAMQSINNLANIKGALDFGHTLGGIVIGAAILLGIIVLLFACCTSGDTRNNVYSGWKSKFCGKFVSSILMLIEYLLYFAWSLLSICMMAPVMLQIILNAVCNITPKCINLKELGLGPFLKYAKNNTVSTNICSSELKNFCKHVNDAGTPLLIALAGCFIAALGTVHVLMCLSSNYAYVHSFKKTRKPDDDAGEHVRMS